MRYLPRDSAKKDRLQTALVGATYREGRDNSKIKAALLSIQRPNWVQTESGFCAYTERFCQPLHSVDIEHFDPDLKNKPEDHPGNWFAVLHRPNIRKPRKIDDYRNMLHPLDPSLLSRIKIEDEIFKPKDPDDIEVAKLINWLGTNLPEVVAERKNHIARIKRICPDFPVGFWELAVPDPMFLSFLSAILQRFGISEEEAAQAYSQHHSI